MVKRCPHCGRGVGEPWHESHGLAQVDKGWIEAGIPVVGRIKLQREVIVVVYFCLRTGMPFLMTLPSAK